MHRINSYLDVEINVKDHFFGSFHGLLQSGNSVSSFSVEFDHVLVELEQSLTVGHREQGDLQLLGFVVQLGLHVHAHGAGALIQDGEQGLVIEQSSHCHSLLLSARKDVVPVVDSIEAAFSFHNVGQLHVVEDLEQILRLKNILLRP